MPRFRIEYSKEGPIAFISHLDLSKAWERAARRAGLPVVLSQGFHPHYRISFGSVLPVGVEGAREYLDLELKEDFAPGALKKVLDEELPSGLVVRQVVPVNDQAASLMAGINTAEYSFEVGLERDLTGEDLAERWRKMQGIEKWMVTRRNKKGEREIDVRPDLIKAELNLGEGKLYGILWLKLGHGGSARPPEVFKALEKYAGIPIDRERISYRRTSLYVERGGQWLSPLYI
ncbi:MAG: DUF2344 domain-containing protein [Firmicutes bacterium]|nr:DUF2344 domain-containing protein [Bacillota bacterium]